MEDMRMTGKRHPYSSDYKIGLDKDLKIVAYEAAFYQNAGASADLSPPVLERTLFHCTNSYYIPNVTATAYSCRTQPAAQHRFSRLWRAAGNVRYRIRDRARRRKTGRFSRPRSSEKIFCDNGDEFPYGQMAESEADNDLDTSRWEI